MQQIIASQCMSSKLVQLSFAVYLGGGGLGGGGLGGRGLGGGGLGGGLHITRQG